MLYGAPIAATAAQAALLAHTGFREHGMSVVVGPEGGLDEGEERALTDAGAKPVSLGVHVLRTETAALAALAAAQGALGHL
jgi:16S rRNA (uracil1498-N3)-methyltransferase